jgi:hypothetical protein
MAPEQFDAAPVTHSMDVFSLGALAFFAIAGRSPRPDAEVPSRLDLSPLDDRHVPRGIAALIRRCLSIDPADRYQDANAVAEDLRRWFTAGVTLAQEATRWELAWLRLHRSPRTRAVIAATLVALVIAGGAWWIMASRSRSEAEARLAQIAASTAIDRAETVAVALDEVRGIASRHPGLASASALQARLQTAYDLAAQGEHEESVRSRLASLLRRTRTHGPWADQVHAWRAAIRDAGLTMDPEQVASDARKLHDSPLRFAIIESLAFLWRAEKERGADHHRVCRSVSLDAAVRGRKATPNFRAFNDLPGTPH